MGKWNGVGGKVNETDASIEEAAIREAQEEINIAPQNIKLMAVLKFYHINDLGAGMEVFVYTTNEWIGEPTESEEMAPRWFNINDIPYSEMWDDDKIWLPKIISGIKLEGSFLFDENQKIVDQEIRVLPNLQKDK